MSGGNSEGMLIGGMIRNYYIAEDNARAAQREYAKARGWMEYAQRLEGDLGDANAQIAELQAEIARLTKVAQDALMDANGRDAQVEAMKAQHQNSPLLADTDQRYKKSGNVKTKLRLIYEQAFDAYGRDKLKIANPADRRID